MPESKRLRYVFLKQNGGVEETVSTKTLVQRIQSGQLSPNDEISAEGKHWVRLIQHSQLAPFFAEGQAKKPAAPEKAQAPAKPAAPAGKAQEPASGQAEPVAAATVEEEMPRGAEEASSGQKKFLVVMLVLLALILAYNLMRGQKPAGPDQPPVGEQATVAPKAPALTPSLEAEEPPADGETAAMEEPAEGETAAAAGEAALPEGEAATEQEASVAPTEESAPAQVQ